MTDHPTHFSTESSQHPEVGVYITNENPELKRNKFANLTFGSTNHSVQGSALHDIHNCTGTTQEEKLEQAWNRDFSEYLRELSKPPQTYLVVKIPPLPRK